MALILITNDDGIDAVGIRVLAETLGDLGELLLAAPERPRSAAGMSLTFHKPLRIQKRANGEIPQYAISGNPADCVFLAIRELLGGKLPALVVSGINLGDNVTAQTVYASGTVAGAIQAALIGIPSVALSLAIPEERPPPEAKLSRSYRIAALASRKIIQWMLGNKLPSGVDYLNVNFPYEIKPHTPARPTWLALHKYDNEVLKRRDPKGRPYFWLYGEMLGKNRFPKYSDAHAVHVEKVISITPMRLDASSHAKQSSLNSLIEFLNHQ